MLLRPCRSALREAGARGTGHGARTPRPTPRTLRSSSLHVRSEVSRVFMRRSVLACDVMIFMPAAWACAAAGAPKGALRLGFFALLCALPPLVLVDHGHFQYNCVSLGLALWAMHAAMAGRPLATCAAFSLALNFKQMSLYLAPAFFCYLLAGCVRPAARGGGAAAWRLRRGQQGGGGLGRVRWACAAAVRVARLGGAVLCTFALCWLPFLGSVDATLAVLRRVFPVGRHLYEDKAPTYYCLLLTTHYYSPLTTTHHSLLTTHCSPLTTHCSLLTAHCSLLTAHCLLRTVHCLLLTAHSSLLLLGGQRVVHSRVAPATQA